MSLPRCLLTLAFTGLLAAQSLSHQLDSALEAWSAPDRPGGAFVLIRDGKIAYRNVSGLANLESKAPIDLKTQFLLASVSKQFTAMAVMMLKKSCKLSYNDVLATPCPAFSA